MFYFGPWDQAGHYFFDENGRSIWEEKIPGFPFGHDGGKIIVDERGACNSNYFAEGTFTFEQMVEMAKTRFAHRWNKMKFEVTPCALYSSI